MPKIALPRPASSLQWYSYLTLAIISIVSLLALNHDVGQVSDHAVNHTRLLLISISVTVPEIIIWLIAIMGAVRFKEYAMSVKNSKDGSGFNDIGTALLLMSLYVIAMCIENSIVSLFAHTSGLRAAVFLGNHLPLLLAFASAVYLFRGAQKLHQLVPLNLDATYLVWISICCILLFGAFAWDIYRTVPSLQPAYGIPRFTLGRQALLFTYVIPYVITWTLGLVSCITIAHYARHTKGTIYRFLLGNLYKGVLVVYICTFFAQLFVASNVRLDHFSIAIVLIYLLLIAGAGGFWLINRGATQLRKLEQV